MIEMLYTFDEQFSIITVPRPNSNGLVNYTVADNETTTSVTTNAAAAHASSFLFLLLLILRTTV